MADGDRRGHARPHVIGHENVEARFERYRRTNGWNLAVNARQFGPAVVRPRPDGTPPSWPAS